MMLGEDPISPLCIFSRRRRCLFERESLTSGVSEWTKNQMYTRVDITLANVSVDMFRMAVHKSTFDDRNLFRFAFCQFSSPLCVPFRSFSFSYLFFASVRFF